jgi:nicotinate-nucleotide--dimethylbenzimidazole phosphoribosyltransferase
MRVLVLGGIRSGKSALAEALVADVERVRYVATATADADNAEWSKRLAAHRARRPATWSTEEVGDEPGRLAALLTEASDDDVLLVDDLGGWLAAGLDGDVSGAIETLVTAVQDCPAERLVLVAPEVGLSVVPATAAGLAFADASGTLNQRVAAACESVAFVVAGQPTWLRGGPTFPRRPEKPFTADGTAAWTAPVSLGDVPDLQPGLDLPMPDDAASGEAGNRLRTLAFAGAGLGTLASVVLFAAATQGRPDPRPWRAPRTLLLRGDHAGGVAAGYSPDDAQRAVDAALDGSGTLAMLAATAGSGVQLVDCPPALAIEEQDALDEATVEEALKLGWRLAQSAVDEGVDLLVLAACGSGAEAAGAAVTAVATGGEPAALLDRVVQADGFVDDEAWMRRCMAVRDARHRIRARGRDPRSLLATVGGGDVAVATGVLLGATARQTPVLIDGPVGVAAGLVARDFGAQIRHWLILPDHGEHPTTKLAADVLGAAPLLSLKLALGEGATALTVLPLLNTALTLAAATPVRPAPPPPSDDPADIEAEIERVAPSSGA